jgi:hypothetical protein
METPKSRSWLLGMAVVILLLLLIAPPIGWLVRTQLAAQVMSPNELFTLLSDLGVQQAPSPPASFSTRRRETLRTLAQDHPNDAPIQLAYALQTTVGGKQANAERLAQLRALTTRFPNQPALYAHALRYATQYEIHIDRDKELWPQAASSSFRSVPRAPATPEQLAAFDQDAATGERLEPDNAFFPFMRVIGLLTARRDAEALVALHRAAGKPRFEDYVNEEPESLLRAAEQTDGRLTALQRLAIQGSVLYPHYALLRAAARDTTGLAIRAEQAGHTEEGFAIRHDLMRCGSLMRVQSRPLVGSLVGIAIVAIAESRPGGAPALPSASNQTAAQLERATQQRESDYLAYLTRIGHPEEARWVQAEMAAGLEAKSIANRGMERGPMGQMFALLASRWISSLILLSSALCMLILSLTALLVSRLDRVTSLFTLIIVSGLLLVFLLFSPQAEWVWAFSAFYTVIQNLSGGDTGNALSSFGELALLLRSVGLARFFVTAPVLVSPALTLVGLGMVSLYRRESFVTVLIRGLQSAGAGVACILLLLYGGMAWMTVREEAAINTGLERSLQHEGRYYAQLIGQNWPASPPEDLTPGPSP